MIEIMGCIKIKFHAKHAKIYVKSIKAYALTSRSFCFHGFSLRAFREIKITYMNSFLK
jgi:hypothetical protein